MWLTGMEAWKCDVLGDLLLEKFARKSNSSSYPSHGGVSQRQTDRQYINLKKLRRETMLCMCVVGNWNLGIGMKC